MSKIVSFRDDIINKMMDDIPDLKDVDWYDGIFDEADIKEWSMKFPAARVAVMNVPTQHHSTMEMNASLRVVVVVVAENQRGDRDADARNWELLESIAVWANLNAFGNGAAMPATKVKFQRLSDPELRNEGVAIGVVEWESVLKIGKNRVHERDFVWHNGQMVTKVPQTRVTAQGYVHDAAGNVDERDVLDITPDTDEEE